MSRGDPDAPLDPLLGRVVFFTSAMVLPLEVKNQVHLSMEELWGDAPTDCSDMCYQVLLAACLKVSTMLRGSMAGRPLLPHREGGAPPPPRGSPKTSAKLSSGI